MLENVIYSQLHSHFSRKTDEFHCRDGISSELEQMTLTADGARVLL